MLSSLDDTIAAIITPIGEGGIAVIRLSGKRSMAISSSMFRGHQDLVLAASHTAHVGYFVDENEEVVDEVIVTVFKSPHSYTTEDCVEISCHGAMFIANRILNTCLKAGARHADPGEFTKRAFLHGRIDLSQAEAVAALIHSRSDAAHKASLNQLRGMHTNFFSKIHDSIVELCSLLELDLDFTEDDLSIIETSSCIKKLQDIEADVIQLINSYEFGKIFRDGVKVVLVGNPNVGKSSILNVLINQNRSIVTDISGTTRDTIEELIAINGIQFKVVDSAGIRETNDVIEAEGIKRTLDEVRTAQVIAYVVDVTKEEQFSVVESINSLLKKTGVEESRILVVFNKVDLLSTANTPLITSILSYDSVKVSAKYNVGITELKGLLVKKANPKILPQSIENVTITNSRHLDSLISVKKYIEKSIGDIRSNVSNEFIIVELRNALHCLDEITGAVTNEDILNKIFDGFCIGK